MSTTIDRLDARDGAGHAGAPVPQGGLTAALAGGGGDSPRQRLRDLLRRIAGGTGMDQRREWPLRLGCL